MVPGSGPLRQVDTTIPGASREPAGLGAPGGAAPLDSLANGPQVGAQGFPYPELRTPIFHDSSRLSGRPLRVAFVVQGDGRGHMTQALAVRSFLADAGHDVVAAYLGVSPMRPVPEYFAPRVDAPLHTFAAPTLVPDRQSRGISFSGTAMYNACHVGSYVSAGLTIWRSLRGYRPDVLVNFFDMTAGFVHLLGGRRILPPQVAVAHSYLLDHPETAAAPSGARGRLGLKLLSRIVALGAHTVLGLSFDELPDTATVRVAPPLLRPGSTRPTATDRGYLLSYALNMGYARDVAAWQARHPDVEVHCYVPDGGRGSDVGGDARLHLHDLDDTSFLNHLAGCRAYVGTAGFESLCEAFHLGKPVLAVPVDGHYEQAFNAADVRRAGVATTGSFHDLDAFWTSLPVPPPERVESFRRWVSRAPEIIVGAVEEAARRGCR